MQFNFIIFNEIQTMPKFTLRISKYKLQSIGNLLFFLISETVSPTYTIFSVKYATADLNNTFKFREYKEYLRKLESAQTDRQTTPRHKHI